MFRSSAVRYSALRLYSTSNLKPSIKLVAEIRKATEVSISKAREALVATNNDVGAAIEWLQKDLITSGAKKAAKIEGKAANEGLVGLSILARGCGEKHWGVRAAMVELNCETDFVAKNELFGKLAADIAHTAAFMSEQSVNSKATLVQCPLDVLNGAPLIPEHPIPGSRASSQTVANSVLELIAKVGEKITLRRAVVAVQSMSPSAFGCRVISYAHGFTNPSLGRIGTLAILGLRTQRLPELLQTDSFLQRLNRLERSLGRQIVGFGAQSIRSPPGTTDETALYDTPFMMLDGSEDSVEVALKKWSKTTAMIGEGDPETEQGVHVLEIAKWTVGESLNVADAQ